jgi:hypothetical protein
MSLKKNIAIFRSSRPWLNKESKSVPVPTQSVMPEWYKKGIDANI